MSSRNDRRVAAKLCRKASSAPKWEPLVRKVGVENHPNAPCGLVAGYVNAIYSVQVFAAIKSPLGIVVPVGVRRHDTEPIRKWHDMQRIKTELFGVDRVAVEVYPAEIDVSDAANMYWLWLLPAGVRFPFKISEAV